MCSPALMRQITMPAHAPGTGHAHGHAHAETGASAPERAHHVHARTAHDDGASARSAGAGRLVGRRNLFRLSAASTAGIAAGAAMSGVASAESVTAALSHNPRIADLTHELGEDFPVFWPLVPQPEFHQTRSIDVDGFNVLELKIDEHSGTHIDPPGHFHEGGLTVEKLPVEWLVAPLAVIRIADRAARDPETGLTVRDIRRYESRYGRLPARSVVAMDSGWWRRVPQPGAYNNQGADGRFRFPCIMPEAAEFLVEERNIVGVAVDTNSLDGGNDAPTSHQILLPAGKYGIESIAALDTAPDRGALLVVGAPKHRGGFGGQIRALALY
ncbi:cyclase family protein [Streptomyces sp. NPDC049881]|uniref:cyclase family protein n=1 Tax=unclassified Streptomyces TaxID=2593676 RepID=UPI00341B614D